jgi:hypothetical protein
MSKKVVSGVTHPPNDARGRLLYVLAEGIVTQMLFDTGRVGRGVVGKE